MRFLLSALLVLATIGIAHAAPDGEQDQPSSPQVRRPAPDFLFGRPGKSLGFRGSWVFSRAGSDWYDFVGDQLTIEDGAFNAPAFGIELGISVAPRLEIVIGSEFSGTTAHSEYRHFVDNNRLPINQVTELREANIGGSLRFALTPRGREVGRLAWVPRALVPYVGAGGGASWFSLYQHGDFVDFVDLSIFTDAFESSGWAPSAHVFGGAEIKLHRRVYLTVETRYLWAAGDLGVEWIDFDPIDLAGLRLSTGVNFTF